MSRLPLEQMMASLRPVVVSSSKFGTIAGALSTVVIAVSSHAAVGLGQAGDIGHLLGRLLGEQGEQLLGGDAADDGHPAQGGSLALDGVVGAQEPDGLPMRVGQVDAGLRGELLGQGVVPLVVNREEPLVVNVDVAAGDAGDRHGFTPRGVCRPSTCVPATGWAGRAAGRSSTSTGTRACPSG